jgi:16S rRNA (uracil1498-N3)-methyltransferase
VATENIKERIRIEERETIHKIRDVLRLKKSKKIYVFNGEGKEYLYEIKEIKKNVIFLEKEKFVNKEDLPSTKIILAFPLLKEEKINFILQKCTELGVDEFYPFICERSIIKKPNFSKFRRWQKIILEATRQSNRLWLPKLKEIKNVEEIAHLKFSLKLVASQYGKYLEKSLRKEKEIFIIVGPEGDFSPSEYKILNDNDFVCFKLSPYTLRTETAAVFSVGLISYLYR